MLHGISDKELYITKFSMHIIMNMSMCVVEALQIYYPGGGIA